MPIPFRVTRSSLLPRTKQQSAKRQQKQESNEITSSWDDGSERRGRKDTTASQITRMPNRNGHMSQLGAFVARIRLVTTEIALGFTK